MALDYVLPKLAMAMNEGTVNEWLVQDGEYVEKGSPLVIVETEKVSYDLESPQSGYFRSVVAQGETVPVETLIGHFAESEDELKSLNQAVNNGAEGTPQESASEKVEGASERKAGVDSVEVAELPRMAQKSGRLKASPLARKMAKDANISLSQMSGSGPGGRIVKRDIVAALDQGVAIPPSLPVEDLSDRKLCEKTRIPLKGVRGVIARRMMESLQSTAQLSTSWETDITRLIEVRKGFVQRSEQLGTRISVNAFIIKAIACAAKQVPIVNSAVMGDEIVIYDNINVGIAIATPGMTEWDSGLIVPVIKNADRLGLADIDLRMKRLIERAHNGELDADDMSDSTITFSSTAGLYPPGMVGTPILNLPNATLVSPSTPQDKPVVVNSEVVVRRMMPINMTFDHRAIDGEPSARFASALHELLQSPELMLA